MLSIFLLRENDNTGIVFGIIFGARNKDKFALSNMIVGESILILKPCLDGKWAYIRTFTSSEPSLLSEPNRIDFIPSPFPKSVRCVLLVILIWLILIKPLFLQ